MTLILGINAFHADAAAAHRSHLPFGQTQHVQLVEMNAAAHHRGVTGWVERPGTIHVGMTVRIVPTRPAA